MGELLIKSFCRGVQGGRFFQKEPPLAAGGVLNCNLGRFRGSEFQFRAKYETVYCIIGVSLAAQEFNTKLMIRR
jgi:hypothetical protein